MKLALIPARGGSKRIFKKNIKNFLGKPLISYSIQAALDSKLFDEVMVSTDDQEIKEVALKYGASVPFLRSEKNSNDFALTADVIHEVLMEYQKRYKNFEHFCCIYPTAPFLSGHKLRDSYELLLSSKYKTVFSMCRFSYPIQRAFHKSGNTVKMLWPENYTKRSQDLKPCFHDAGQFYWGEIDNFLQTKKLFSDYTSGYELSELEVQDIDNEIDWKLAEMKYQLMEK